MVAAKPIPRQKAQRHCDVFHILLHKKYYKRKIFFQVIKLQKQVTKKSHSAEISKLCTPSGSKKSFQKQIIKKPKRQTVNRRKL